jgi:flagellar hook-basal body complex protein FliE
MSASGIQPVSSLPASSPGDGGAAKSGGGFGDLLRSVLDDANRAQVESDRALESLSRGEGTDVHDVMLALTRADLSFRLLVEVRDRLVEAYQEVQRMQI